MLWSAAIIFMLSFSVGSGTSHLVQSLIVDFPKNGKVIVQAREEVGKNPRILIISQATGKVLLDYLYDESDDSLKPRADGLATEPFLRFRVLHSKGFRSPLILAVAVSPGGSDDGFCGAVIGEVNGRLKALTAHRLYISIQGGFYLGFLNRKFGYGLASWTFIWGNEVHYDYHHYEIDIYSRR